MLYLMIVLCPFWYVAGGRWRCLHIDDPRAPRFALPSWRDCIGSKTSEIIHTQLCQFNVDDMPELESDDETQSGVEHNIEVRNIWHVMIRIFPCEVLRIVCEELLQCKVLQLSLLWQKELKCVFFLLLRMMSTQIMNFKNQMRHHKKLLMHNTDPLIMIKMSISCLSWSTVYQPPLHASSLAGMNTVWTFWNSSFELEVVSVCLICLLQDIQLYQMGQAIRLRPECSLLKHVDYILSHSVKCWTCKCSTTLWRLNTGIKVVISSYGMMGCSGNSKNS